MNHIPQLRYRNILSCPVQFNPTSDMFQQIILNIIFHSVFPQSNKYINLYPTTLFVNIFSKLEKFYYLLINCRYFLFLYTLFYPFFSISENPPPPAFSIMENLSIRIYNCFLVKY